MEFGKINKGRRFKIRKNSGFAILTVIETFTEKKS